MRRYVADLVQADHDRVVQDAVGQAAPERLALVNDVEVGQREAGRVDEDAGPAAIHVLGEDGSDGWADAIDDLDPARFRLLSRPPGLRRRPRHRTAGRQTVRACGA